MWTEEMYGFSWESLQQETLAETQPQWVEETPWKESWQEKIIQSTWEALAWVAAEVENSLDRKPDRFGQFALEQIPEEKFGFVDMEKSMAA